ncbi:bifunctional 4-hydroxy-2-oxoglutarate aldolase/2-dehydro-3-deoxy-phosphogluconate aldolase [Nocardioides sp. GY 10127]|nr:bifunctional 4-hydroxy-2-oxoglutarate aldolase/2-dehydro-3-deoxy-phosphogluconate aldolase [Nocardioides sp. GY 10127]
MGSAAQAERVAHAAIEGGVRVLEIPLTTPDALSVVRTLADEYGEEIAVGTGTVLDADAAHRSLDAGASVIVTPHVAPDVLAVAKAAGALALGGAFTPTEVLASLRAGSDVVKLFPAEALGPSYLKSIKAPLAHVPICPTGGVTPGNAAEWFAAGATAVGAASYITKAGGADLDPVLITKAAAEFVGAVADARAGR